MRGRLDGLDVLRGIAALCVLYQHLPEYVPGLSRGFHGYLAVDFFFMLSGYVIARTYEHRFAEAGVPFLWKRYKRFWPTMALGTLIGLPMLAAYGPVLMLKYAFLGFLLLPSFGTVNAYPVNVVAWSIAFELIANAFHRSVFHRLTTAQLLAATAIMGLLDACLAARFGTLNLGAQAATFFALPRVLFPYLAGIVLWRVWRDRPSFTVPSLPALIALPAWAAIAQGWLADIAFVAVICPLMMAGGLRLRAPLAGALLGALSFPIYAVQAPVMDLTRLMGGHWLLGVALALAVAASAACAPLAWRRWRARPAAAGLEGLDVPHRPLWRRAPPAG